MTPTTLNSEPITAPVDAAAIGAVALPGEPTSRATAASAGSGLIVICAWHKGFDPRDPANRGASHGICESCQARLEQEMAHA